MRFHALEQVSGLLVNLADTLLGGALEGLLCVALEGVGLLEWVCPQKR